MEKTIVLEFSLMLRDKIEKTGKYRVFMSDDTGHKMSRTELIIQLVKVALGLAIGAYFVWWSLEVLQRLPPH